MPIAEILGELISLVDQLEADRSGRRDISRQTADELHALLERTERLFNNPAQVR